MPLVQLININDDIINYILSGGVSDNYDEIIEPKLNLDVYKIIRMGGYLPKNSEDIEYFMQQNVLIKKSNLINRFSKILSKVPVKLKINNIPVVILILNPDYDFAIKNMNSILGYTVHNKIIIILKLQSINDIVKVDSILIHEYCHLLRNRHNEKKKNGLYYVIEEGMAERFVQYILGDKHINPWAHKNSALELFNEFNYFKKMLDTCDIENIYILLNGSKLQDIPHWFGYSMGYQIINFLTEVENILFVDLLEMKTSEIINLLDLVKFENYLKGSAIFEE